MAALSRSDWGRLVAVAALLAAVTVLWGVPMLAGVFLILAMLFLHELGHYLTAKWAGMKVSEFCLGFGPRLWSHQRGETMYGLRALPLGAYVRIVGMTSMEEVAPADEHRTYRSKPYWRRLSVAVAGSAMHFLLALVLIFSYLVAGGRTESVPSPDWTVDRVSTGTPAEQAGLLPGDRIVSVDGTRVATMDEMVAALPGPGKTARLGVLRDGGETVLAVTLGHHPQDPSRGFVGVASATARSRQPVNVGYLDAAPEAAGEFGFMVKESALGIGRFFSLDGLGVFFGTVADQATGSGEPSDGGGAAAEPSSAVENRVLSIIGVLHILSGLISDLTEDYGTLLLLLAVVNVFIGVFNMIPLPPFDGGHIVIATYERIRSRRGRRYIADASKMAPLAYAVIALLLIVGGAAVYLDVADPINLPS